MGVGVAMDHAEIARRTGLTQGAVTQILNLTLLAPDIQKEILVGQPGVPDVERELRVFSGKSSWSDQVAARRRSLHPALQSRSGKTPQSALRPSRARITL